jgi:hypothetical protein
MAPPQPPLVADVLSYLLLAALLYLFFYSVRLRRELRRSEDLGGSTARAQVSTDGESRSRSQRIEYYIEPSPIPGQQIPYPTIANIGEELSVSIVIPVNNCETHIVDRLQRISDYFDGCPSLTYEILVVDMFSSDTTRERALEFAEDHRAVRVLRIPRSVPMLTAVLIGCSRTRGRAIFLFNPSDKIPISAFSKYYAKFEKVLKFSTQAFIVGQWKQVPEDYTILRSALNILVESIADRLLSVAGVRESAIKHARTFLMTRDALRAVSAGVDTLWVSYATTMVVLASQAGAEVRAAKLDQPDSYKYSTRAAERLDDLAVALQGVIDRVTKHARSTLTHRRKVLLSEL